ncbi:MAG: class II fructose-bisphosphate aldolase [Clostridiales bacterium]|nr:class II fructose-bisphosphate aldolase [Clostridiales bacterium]
MLVNLKEILAIAEKEKIAIGSFNTPNLESIQAVIGAAEELNVPVIIMHAEVHESMMPLRVIGKVMLQCARDAAVPVCVHLDHGEHLEYLAEALELGFTSVMYDGSALPYEENRDNTCTAVRMAKETGASLEAEIGTLGKREMGYQEEENEAQPEKIYTNPEDAEQFVKETGIDALACSFGTAHGLYLTKPKLDMHVLDEVRKRVDVPLVMHGGSGVSPEDYRTVIEKGIRKINYYTYMSKAGGEGVAEKITQCLKENRPVYYHDVAAWGTEAMKEDVKKALRVFSGM